MFAILHTYIGNVSIKVNKRGNKPSIFMVFKLYRSIYPFTLGIGSVMYGVP